MRSNVVSLRNSQICVATKTPRCAKAFSTARRNFFNKGPAGSVLSNAVKLIECPRDAWQGLKRQIPTELKAQYLRALIAAGFKHIDAVSFVSPKAVPTLGYPYSISETFLRKNQNQTLEECYKALQSIRRRADKAGLGMVAYISMAFGNPYADPWDEDQVLQAVKKLAGIG